MQGRFHDGVTSAARAAEAVLADGRLIVRFEGGEASCPAAALEVEPLGDRVRLSAEGQPWRLILPAEAWRAASADGQGRSRPRWRPRQVRLVAGLTLAAAGLAAFVFVAMPALSGPLARHTPPEFEKQIGDSFDAQVGLAFRPCPDGPGQTALHDFGQQLGRAADTPFEVRVEAVHAPMVNAFALPGGRILVTDELIDLARTPDELSAVLAHEVAHVEKRHVMQAVWRSLGLGLVLDAIVGGGSGAGQQAVLLAGSATNLRYSRKAEAEADARGQALLEAQHLSSRGMAAFFQRLAAQGEGADAAAVKELLSDHPGITRRAAASRAREHAGASAFTPEAWRAIKAACPARPAPLKRLRDIL